MSNVIYRKLAVEECNHINEMNPSQYIGITLVATAPSESSPAD